MLRARHAARMGGELLRFGVRTGLWWVPVMIPVLAIAALVIAAAHAVVPTVVYVFF